MNYLKLSGIALLILLCCNSSFSQQTAPINEPDYNKPRLFNDLPSQIPVSTAELEQLISGERQTGKEVNLRFAESKMAPFEGKIVSAADKYNNKIKSIVVRSERFNGATMTITSSTNEDGSVTYTGRIISLQHADTYELKEIKGQYQFIKKNYYELISE